MTFSSVSSDFSFSNSRLVSFYNLFIVHMSDIPTKLSSARSSLIPQRNLIHSTNNSPTFAWNQPDLPSHSNKPQSAPLTQSEAWPGSFHPRKVFPHLNHADMHPRTQSRLSEPTIAHGDEGDEWDEQDRRDHVIRRAIPHAVSVTRPFTPIARSPFHAIATPRPTLLFAIASDDVMQVRHVLESGDAGPNDQVGPLSALEFAITNDKLTHKIGIVKTLLAFGADPSPLTNPERNSPRHQLDSNDLNKETSSPRGAPSYTLLPNMDPAIR